MKKLLNVARYLLAAYGGYELFKIVENYFEEKDDISVEESNGNPFNDISVQGENDTETISIANEINGVVERDGEICYSHVIHVMEKHANVEFFDIPLSIEYGWNKNNWNPKFEYEDGRLVYQLGKPIKLD